MKTVHYTERNDVLKQIILPKTDDAALAALVFFCSGVQVAAQVAQPINTGPRCINYIYDKDENHTKKSNLIDFRFSISAIL